MTDWAQRIDDHGFDEAFVFFKHEEDGADPRMAVDFVAAVERLKGLRKPAKVRRPARKVAAAEHADLRKDSA